jgi:hypothetical protein
VGKSERRGLSRRDFLNGDAVFPRQWTYVYALTSDPEDSKLKPERLRWSPAAAFVFSRRVSP